MKIKTTLTPPASSTTASYDRDIYEGVLLQKVMLPSWQLVWVRMCLKGMHTLTIVYKKENLNRKRSDRQAQEGICWQTPSTWQLMVIFPQKYRSCHPETYFFSSSEKNLFWLKVSNKYVVDFENRSTDGSIGDAHRLHSTAQQVVLPL